MHLLLKSFLICLGVTCTIATFSPPTTALDSAAPHDARPARSFSGVIETLDGERLSRATVRLTSIGTATTSDAGEFVIPLPQRLQPSDPIEISLGDEWVVVRPWEGEGFLPPSLAEVVHFRVARKGDPRLLADPKLVRRIVASLTSLLGSKIAFSTNTDQLLAEKVGSLGFSLDQVKFAIEEWSKKVQVPYEKGLAALYARHYAEASEFIRQAGDVADEDQVERYLSLAYADYRLGRYPEALTALTAAREIQPDNPQVLDRLANVLEVQAKYQEAEQLHQLALVINERAFGEDNIHIAPVLNNLALVYMNEGKYAEAEPLYRRAIPIVEKAHGPESLPLATLLDNLGSLYDYEGRYADGEPPLRRAVAIAEKAPIPETHDLAIFLANLASNSDIQGRYAEAESLYKRALAIDEKLRGPEHPDVGSMLNNLALVYDHEGRYREAEPLYKRACLIREKTLGPTHPEVAYCLNNLAGIYVHLGRYA